MSVSHRLVCVDRPLFLVIGLVFEVKQIPGMADGIELVQPFGDVYHFSPSSSFFQGKEVEEPESFFKRLYLQRWYQLRGASLHSLEQLSDHSNRRPYLHCVF